MKQIALSLALFLGLAFSAMAQANGVSVQLSLAQDQFMPDEDVRVVVRITNLSGQPLTLGQDNNWVTFSLQGENKLPIEKIGNVPVAGPFTLQSAQVGNKTFNLTPYFNYRRQGRYRVVATLNLPQWNKQISSEAKYFMVMNGVALASVPEIQFGLPVPEGTGSAAPEVRKYSLQKVAYLQDLKLYFRLSDEAGKTLRVFPIDRMVSFSQPEAQIDRFSNFHVIHQTGAKAFTYCEINPFGQIIARQTYDYTRTRPSLAKNAAGHILVTGGVRHVTPNDLPPPATSSPESSPDAETKTP